ncbi:uncharacterized protein [Lolium perenne]|uniref:uncharacterized protein n=1 Tax=Lolium perenne TaxID=4522 RepID=UPI003A99516D
MSAPIPSDSGVPATTEMEVAAAGGGDGAVTMPPPAPTCPVCMEPWTCNGDHRICCIPCGHVYGRSCLVKWLDRCGDDTAKCPQCGEQFEDKLIINLYAPGNLWDGCCRLEELKAHYKSKIHEMNRHWETAMAEYMEKSLSDTKKLRADLVRQCTELKEQTSKEIAEFHDKTRVEIESLHGQVLQMVDQIVRMWNEQNTTANANLATMKEQMKKMAEEENATATELIDFVERSSPRLSLFSNPHAPASAFAPGPLDSQNNTGWRRSHSDQLPPIPVLACPTDAAKGPHGGT